MPRRRDTAAAGRYVPLACLARATTLDRVFADPRPLVWATLAAIGGVLLVARLLFAASPLSWTEVDASIAARFPTVPTVQPDDLAAWLASSSAPLLLDARALEEFDANHIAGAVRIDPDAPDVTAVLEQRPSTVVVYCSVGWRSARVVEQLRAAGVDATYNLHGGIFRWANEGREVVGAAAPRVHPYDARWGALVDETRRLGID